ncbi:Tm-1-like ATP-binding domain-containing protein [Amycolatopsis jejuensis]|uniref:Tm-1-like ATP-binding domain-containing protein n=1 Tax=Amycolatopsis jejuensis TaxID=330084 RepID=UPI00052610DA|nr:Tm-1-like ATP-binding domain-containing protein [Amycolatopsis jejuensis]
MTATVALLAALDTKADDAAFLKARLEANGHHVLVADIGVLGSPGLPSDVDRSTIAEAGGGSLAELQARRDRAAAVATMAAGAAAVISELVADGRVHAVLALGGGAGTSIGSAAMRDLPLGLPKLILTTVASGNTAGYVGTSDLVLFPSIVDVAGVNRVSAITYTRAADALSGMLAGSRNPDTSRQDRPLVAATMFGVTTPCVLRAKETLEAAGCEVLVFHATGTGGRTMERLVAQGFFDAVLDLTTTEWADEIVGGILSAGPHRLEAAGRAGVPQVVSLGATDMVNFGPPDTVPARFTGRRFYQHNAENTLMRVTPEEAERIGAAIAGKLNAARDVTVLVPRRGVSALDAEGQPFADPAAREALVTALRKGVDDQRVRIEELDLHINDNAFADTAAERVLSCLKETRR